MEASPVLANAGPEKDVSPLHIAPEPPPFVEPVLAGARRWQSFLPSYVKFPVPYPASVAGLDAANEELSRLVELHMAYQSQPDTTRIWQGYINQKAEAVSEQRTVISRLERALSATP